MKTSAKRKIYIESSVLSQAKRTGVGHLAEGLIGPLVKNNPQIEFIFFRFASDGEQLAITGQNVREIVIHKLPGKVFRLLLLAGLAPSLEWLTGENEITEVIFPAFYAWPIRTGNARIYPLIPDTIFLDLPQYVEHFYFRKLLYKGVKTSVQVATQVLTCSEASKQSIQKHFGVLPEHISVLYPGYTKPKPVKMNKLPVQGDYILFVGTLEPRKNVAALIQAYCALDSSLRAKYQLVLAGGKGWYDEEIQALVQEHSRAGVVALGYVDATTKTALYENATVFAYPVLYEGFGMPIIEAQAHGLPVLTARNTSLTEAGGEAALYCDTDVSAIQKGLAALLTNVALRQKLSQQGKRHAATFTWQRSVMALQKILQIK